MKCEKKIIISFITFVGSLFLFQQWINKLFAGVERFNEKNCRENYWNKTQNRYITPECYGDGEALVQVAPFLLSCTAACLTFSVLSIFELDNRNNREILV